MVDEMTKSPSILSNVSHRGDSPTDKLPDGDDRISIQSEKSSGGDPHHLRVGSKKVKAIG